MKTTVKTDTGRAVVQPLSLSNCIMLAVHGNSVCTRVTLTPDQAGALIFGMERALEVIDQRHRAALENIRATA